MDKHITHCSIMTPWYSWGTFFLLYFFYCVLATRFWIPTDTALGFCVGVLACSVAVSLIHRFLLDGDVVLTDWGVEVRGRIRRSCAWKNCTQVIAMRYDRERVLVLLKSNGSPMKKGEENFWFFLRNPGKVIFLPDDKFTRAFVRTYYGEPDFEQEKPSP